MAQEYDGHLTTEQLSAMLDGQASHEERLDWNAHLRECQQCQRRLADLRQTVALLHALPQAELPRSFVLPASTALTPEQYLHPVTHSIRGSKSRELIMPITHARRNRSSIVRRSVRALSTLAAVVGFLLIAAGFLAGAHIGEGGTYTTSTASNGAGQTTNNSSSAIPEAAPPDQTANAASTGHERVGAATPHVTQTPSVVVKSVPSQPHAQDGHLSQPSSFDLTTPVTLEEAGLILLALGFFGMIAMRLVRRRDVRT